MLNHEELKSIGIHPDYHASYQRPSWDEYFFKLVNLIKLKSHDSETSHGCVIVRPDHTIAVTGYNGFPPGSDDEALPNVRKDGSKYWLINHSEISAINAAAKHGISLIGCRIYITGRPCYNCARALISVGIKEWIIGDVGHQCTREDELRYQYLVEDHKVLVRKFDLNNLSRQG